MTATPTNNRLRIKINWKHPRMVRLDWWEKAASSLPTGKGLHLCVGLWMMMSIRRTPSVQLSRRMMARVNISRYAVSDTLRRLEAAGLVKVARMTGRSPLITATEPGTSIPLRLHAAT